MRQYDSSLQMSITRTLNWLKLRWYNSSTNQMAVEFQPPPSRTLQCYHTSKKQHIATKTQCIMWMLDVATWSSPVSAIVYEFNAIVVFSFTAANVTQLSW